MIHINDAHHIRIPYTIQDCLHISVLHSVDDDDWSMLTSNRIRHYGEVNRYSSINRQLGTQYSNEKENKLQKLYKFMLRKIKLTNIT